MLGWLMPVTWLHPGVVERMRWLRLLLGADVRAAHQPHPPAPGLQAALSQESAAEETQPASLQAHGLALPWLVGGGGGGGDADVAANAGPAASAAKTADEVLAEVDAALAAAEEAMERGRNPSLAAWHSVAGASSGSTSVGHGSASLRRGLPAVANGQLVVA
jgi:hypothetical protein